MPHHLCGQSLAWSTEVSLAAWTSRKTCRLHLSGSCLVRKYLPVSLHRRSEAASSSALCFLFLGVLHRWGMRNILRLGIFSRLSAPPPGKWPIYPVRLCPSYPELCSQAVLPVLPWALVSLPSDSQAWTWLRVCVYVRVCVCVCVLGMRGGARGAWGETGPRPRPPVKGNISLLSDGPRFL